MCPRIDCASLDATLCYIFLFHELVLLEPHCLYLIFSTTTATATTSATLGYILTVLSRCTDAMRQHEHRLVYVPGFMLLMTYKAFIPNMETMHYNVLTISNLLISENSICRSELTYKFYFYKNKLLIFVKISQKQ